MSSSSTTCPTTTWASACCGRRPTTRRSRSSRPRRPSASSRGRRNAPRSCACAARRRARGPRAPHAARGARWTGCSGRRRTSPDAKRGTSRSRDSCRRRRSPRPSTRRPCAGSTREQERVRGLERDALLAVAHSQRLEQRVADGQRLLQEGKTRRRQARVRRGLRDRSARPAGARRSRDRPGAHPGHDDTRESQEVAGRRQGALRRRPVPAGARLRSPTQPPTRRISRRAP